MALARLRGGDLGAIGSANRRVEPPHVGWHVRVAGSQAKEEVAGLPVKSLRQGVGGYKYADNAAFARDLMARRLGVEIFDVV
jgi:hypothetical protein